MTKYKLILSLLTLISLTACEKAEVGEESPKGTAARILFTTFTSSLTETGTRASLTDAKCTKLDFAMFDSNGRPYRTIQQESTDAGFGTIELTDVPYGTYSVVLVGTAGSKHATIVSPELASFGSGILDTFCKYLTLNVDKSTEAQQSVELSRITSEFQLVSTDVQPEGVDSLQILITGGNTCFNPMTGLSPNADLNVREIKASIAHKQGQVLNIGFLTFLPAEEANISVVVNTKDASGTVNYSQSFPAAPMKVNCITRYSGKFFLQPSSSTAATVTVNNEWADTFNYSF